MTKATRQRVIRIFGAIFTLVVLVVLGRTFREEGPAAWEAFRSRRVVWWWILLACALGFVGHTVSILGWRKLLTDMGVPLSFRENVRMFLVGNLGRYLPAGKVWQMGIVSSMAAERGYNPAQIAATSLLQGFVGVVVGATLLFLFGGTLLRRSILWFIVPAALLGLLLALPRIVRSWTWLCEKISTQCPGLEGTSIRTMSFLVLSSFLSWTIWGVALYALSRGLIGARADNVLSHMVAWVGSLLTGLAAVVAPAGLGVRDATMQVILARSGVGASHALIVVVIARVWSTLMEVVPALIMLLVGREKARRHRIREQRRVAAQSPA